MLEFYLSSVIVWFIILFSEIVIFKDQIYKNGWWDPQKKRNIIRSVFNRILTAAIPIFRLLVAIFIFMMATVSKERFNKIAEEYKTKDDDNERPRED